MTYDNSAPFSFTKNGIYYFERRVPRDLKKHYSSSKIVYSLRTRSVPVAISRATRAAQQLDEYWYHLRIRDVELPGKHLLRLRQTSGGSVSFPVSSAPEVNASVPLSEAVAIYLRLKGQNRPATFQRAAERACGYVMDVCGDKDLTHYTKADGNSFRDALLERGMAGSSVTRIFGTVRAVVNFVVSELGLSMPNPFAGFYYDRSVGVGERLPIPLNDIRTLQKQCAKIDDEMRKLVALVSDTGLRLAEAAGLHIDDIRLDDDIPHVVIQEHPWRRLKTQGSRRVVPLVGASRWAAQRVLEVRESSHFAFPRYNNTNKTNANSASAALNKWIKQHLEPICTMHSFRHSMRDRLRAVECPSDVVDQIGGWQTEGVGNRYGQGYPIEVLSRWMEKIA